MSDRPLSRARPFVLTALIVSTQAYAADWPMWRYDAARSAATPHALPSDLHLQWVLQYPPLEPAWPTESRMTFDIGYEPVVMGTTLFVGSSRNDSVTAIDTRTGRQRWRFYADGPVRFAPVAWKDKVYVASDDGCLYCLAAETGELRWKHRGGPDDRRLLGNERLISMWPARGGPVLADGVVYYAASIWPFMGIFVYALDTETGRVVWCNDGMGSMYILQPHNSPAFAGVAPQGHLVAAGDRLLLPGGRSVPAGLDRRTGEFEYYRLAKNGKYGHHHVSVAGEYFTNSGMVYALDDGRRLGAIDRHAVMTPDVVYTSRNDRIRALDLKHPKIVKLSASQKKRFKQSTLMSLPALWELKTEKGAKLFIKAGLKLYAAAKDEVLAVDVPKADGKPEISWRARISGEPHTMLAADDRLFVVTLEGAIYCFGKATGKAKRREPKPAASPTADKWTRTAAGLLKRTGTTEGYCLAYGVGSGRLIEEVARQSKLHVVGFDPDAAKIDRLRKTLDAAGLYGHRVALLAGDAVSSRIAPYLASLIVSEDLSAGGFDEGKEYVEGVFRTLRPYGGVACLPVPADRQAVFAKTVTDAKLANARVDRAGAFATLTRVGALPGSASWTHHYADPENTCVSKDERVKLPLGLLWFGGPSNAKILPRHGHGPTEQVIGGRLFIEGPDVLRALDVYTGRLLWVANLPGLGEAYNNTSHQPGANAIGSNYASCADGIYVIQGEVCWRLDPATGKRLSAFKLPPTPGSKRKTTWGHVKIWKDLLIGGASPLMFAEEPKPGKEDSWDATSSKRLVAMDRHSGKVRWTAMAERAFWHNAICVGGGKVFCIDRFPTAVVHASRRRGKGLTAEAALVAFDVQTGRKAWSTGKHVFGTWLGYSTEHDILLQAGRASRDMLGDEPARRLITHRGKDGTVLWDRRIPYQGPCMLHGETIIAQQDAVGLLDGKRMTRRNPLTGADMPWKWSRQYGCNSAIACQHLVLFRSAAAGYFDLDRLSGTGNFGGFKSGCTSNLVAADGVLSAPDYTRTCTCSYQNQASLALVHMPDVEVWTFNKFVRGDKPIRRMGVNLGAPGDRVAVDGTLWLEFPVDGGPSPRVSIKTTPDKPKSFRHHTSRIEAGPRPWVAASGLRGLRSLTVTLAENAKKPRAYVVRLVFCEPDSIQSGQRVFSVALQGRDVLTGLDVVKEAGGINRSLVKTFKGVRVKDDLTIALAPAESAKIAETILCGVEVLAE